MSQPHSVPNTRALALGALGVVFGDIGTSPLYTMKEVFGGHHLALTQDNVLGILSLIFWALILVVSLKYVLVIMRADNKGEGGILALLSLVQGQAPLRSRARWIIMSLGFLGASLFFGDSLITPAISVLSAVEGLEIGAPALHPFILPLALGILVGLFAIQRRGTASIGRLFGPIMLLWFAVLGVLGAIGIAKHPQVLAALLPIHAIQFFMTHGTAGFLILGAVVLAITGAEALYADMGHFGTRPIRLTWFGFVLPALVVNYFGQGALLLAEPAAVRNPFYMLAPDWALYPMVALATAATVIASQAVISGAFSVTRQVVQMGYAPRLVIRHTSATAAGQIYIPFVNWTLAAGVALLVLGFQSSSNLAAAYGIAVTATFAIDTVLLALLMRVNWNLGRAPTLVAAALFLTLDLAFFGANAVKIPEGGWFPLVVAVVVFTILVTWRRGREIVGARLHERGLPLAPFVESLLAHPPARVGGTAVFMTTDPSGVPLALLHNLKHNKVLHERVVILNVRYGEVPYVPAEHRLAVTKLGEGVFHVVVRYGFMDDVDIPKALAECPCGMDFDMMDTTFFLSRENLIPARGDGGMMVWREHLFATMARNAASPMTFFRIPPNRVVELGAQLEI
ncbi:potassium uptake protein [Thiobacillus denitrificans ATCC 25259]|uniref:Probable potassium transport system protein Kup n=1 Tax=Thiobacillus denitrificans (strain ATCC 25259 / T1) TaxID=292415 RepID=KUP_THIDA|nr:potassium transporter Kup [Thiobacillus denitrificans]Q3SH71.1 RecName: Full=Probable potassium transport system protein Kup [Thiobacillus denitrificans ATCC 25259]AAZ98018.1 potassium uptake protein [Thiobacillus denitrificans ATCC 25259]